MPQNKVNSPVFVYNDSHLSCTHLMLLCIRPVSIADFLSPKIGN